MSANFDEAAHFRQTMGLNRLVADVVVGARWRPISAPVTAFQTVVLYCVAKNDRLDNAIACGYWDGEEWCSEPLGIPIGHEYRPTHYLLPPTPPKGAE